jgi:hypothetical protein
MNVTNKDIGNEMIIHKINKKKQNTTSRLIFTKAKVYVWSYRNLIYEKNAKTS